MSTVGELACSYAVMILEDEGIAITVCFLFYFTIFLILIGLVVSLLMEFKDFELFLVT
jgi:hypothetical protein